MGAPEDEAPAERRITRLLIANRGEIAIRIASTAADLGIVTVAVYSGDDATARHVALADERYLLPGDGVGAYLDIESVISAAIDARCDAIHPGYGFLSENPGLAQRCHEAGITFVGPRAELLSLFGDKVSARAHAVSCGVPVLPGTTSGVSADEARLFLRDKGSIMLKAVAGGGGRGSRVVADESELDEAFERVTSEAERSFGDPSLFAELYLPRARHVEVQILADKTGNVIHLGDRDCSIQRRFQKLVEIAPAPNLSDELREAIRTAAVRLAQTAKYENAATMEFLVDARPDVAAFYFMEANPRLQVEHTVTEEITGIDIVAAQLHIVGGGTLVGLGIGDNDSIQFSGHAIQARVNAEAVTPDGGARPTVGSLQTVDMPSGRGVRVDTAAYAGYAPNLRFDSLLAKIIVHRTTGTFAAVADATARVLRDTRINGIATNLSFLERIISHRDFRNANLHTSFITEHLDALVDQVDAVNEPDAVPAIAAVSPLDAVDPLATLDFFRSGAPSLRKADSGRATAAASFDGGVGTPVVASIFGTVVDLRVEPGQIVRVGEPVLVLEALKMEHSVLSTAGGVVMTVAVVVGSTVQEGDALYFVEERDVGGPLIQGEADVYDLDAIPEALAELQRRMHMTTDGARPDAVARRHGKGKRTARENIAEIFDEGTLMEFGVLAIAAQEQKRSLAELEFKTPADGMITGFGSVNGQDFGPDRARAALCSYDDLVFAGTQGVRGHLKSDRVIELAAKHRMPLIFHAEGSGGRSGDTDYNTLCGLEVRTYEMLSQLSGQVPSIGLVAGRCFAGNAAMLGLTDIIVSTDDSNIGMGGPAVIEGGGLGLVAVEDVGPASVQVRSGVIDVVVEDDAELVRVAKQLLSYYQGPIDRWECEDQRILRHIIPPERAKTFNVRRLISVLADTGSVIELRRQFGLGVVTAFARIEGRPVAIVANNNQFLGGAMDSDASDKAARFAEVADSWGVPLISLVDTPGNMVGPEVERTALVRHCCRVFINLANTEVPVFAIVLRKAYGLGAQAMMGGSTKAAAMNVGWPTAEYGGMNLEAGVKLGSREYLAAIEDPQARRDRYEELVAKAYFNGSGFRVSQHFETDGVIDPAETRKWILDGLFSFPPPARPAPGRRRFIDSW